MELQEGSKILRRCRERGAERNGGKGGTGVISPGYFFNLDYIRSKIRKQHCCCWTRKYTGEINNSETTQRRLNTTQRR